MPRFTDVAYDPQTGELTFRDIEIPDGGSMTDVMAEVEATCPACIDARARGDKHVHTPAMATLFTKRVRRRTR